MLAAGRHVYTQLLDIFQARREAHGKFCKPFAPEVKMEDGSMNMLCRNAIMMNSYTSHVAGHGFRTLWRRRMLQYRQEERSSLTSAALGESTNPKRVYNCSRIYEGNNIDIQCLHNMQMTRNRKHWRTKVLPCWKVWSDIDNLERYPKSFRNRTEAIFFHTSCLGCPPLPVTVATEGLGWDPLLKMIHNPGGDWNPGRGDNPSSCIVSHKALCAVLPNDALRSDGLLCVPRHVRFPEITVLELPSWELTYPIQKAVGKMSFLSHWWDMYDIYIYMDMLVPWRIFQSLPASTILFVDN